MVEDGAVARFISLKVGANENVWIGLRKVEFMSHCSDRCYFIF